MIRLDDVGHVYAAGTPWAHRALAGVQLRIEDGERLLVVGHNGSGKSTLAWILAGLLQPSEGRATLDGELLDAGSGKTAMAFQYARLQLLRPTIAEDVRFGIDADDDAVDAALSSVGLDPRSFRDRRIDDLSGGEQRRVALAGLDAPSRQALLAVLERVGHDSGASTVVVTHDTEDAARLARRAVVLREGGVVADGPVTDVIGGAG